MKALIIAIPILLIGGVFGAAATGMINIPGVTPKKAATTDKKTEEEAAAKEGSADAKSTDVVEEAPTVTEETVVDPEPTADPEAAQVPRRDEAKGAKELAKYWDQVSTPKLIPITDTYKEAELAVVLRFMQKDKVAEILSAIDSTRAARISRELQKLASIVEENPS